jgi:hypothetical protein
MYLDIFSVYIQMNLHTKKYLDIFILQIENILYLKMEGVFAKSPY